MAEVVSGRGGKWPRWEVVSGRGGKWPISLAGTRLADVVFTTDFSQVFRRVGITRDERIRDQRRASFRQLLSRSYFRHADLLLQTLLCLRIPGISGENGVARLWIKNLKTARLIS